VIERRWFQTLSGGRGIWAYDEIAPNNGCPPHGHTNMEIVIYVREGERFGRISSQMSTFRATTQHVDKKDDVFGIDLDDGYVGQMALNEMTGGARAVDYALAHGQDKGL
jgi:hypothetical protein